MTMTTKIKELIGHISIFHLFILLLPILILEAVYTALIPIFHVHSVNPGLHFWCRFLFIAIPTSGNIWRFSGAKKGIIAGMLWFFIFFLYMHGQSSWCCNSPEAQDWKCDEVRNITKSFDQAGIRWRPAWGSAIGVFRRGESIPWEKDEDICVHPDDCTKAHEVMGVTPVHCAQPLDWKHDGYGRNWYSTGWAGPGSTKNSFWHGTHISETHIDLYICYEEKEEWEGPKEKVTFCNMEFSMHSSTRKELSRWYGKGWTEEPITPYPHANSIVFFPRMKFGGLNRIAQDIGCMILLDRGMFYPRGTFQFFVYYLFMLCIMCYIFKLLRISVLKKNGAGGKSVLLPKYN
jgi:hypothetical protein